MIFGFIVKALRAIVDGFARLCAFLLITLDLWLPAVYSLLFLIVCAFANIPLKGTTTTVYVIGLVLSLVGSAWFALRRGGRKTRRGGTGGSPGIKSVQSVKKREYALSDRDDVPLGSRVKAETEYDGDLSSENGSYGAIAAPADNLYSTQASDAENPQNAQSAPDRKRSAKEELYGKPASQSTYDDFSDLKEKYFSGGSASVVSAPSGTGQTDPDRSGNAAGSSAYGNALKESGFVSGNGQGAAKSDTAPSYDFKLNDPISREQLEKRLMGWNTSEKPMVFAMRCNPDIIVYEYSDRLKYFKKTKRGLIHVSTEFKK